MLHSYFNLCNFDYIIQTLCFRLCTSDYNSDYTLLTYSDLYCILFTLHDVLSAANDCRYQPNSLRWMESFQPCSAQCFYWKSMARSFLTRPSTSSVQHLAAGVTLKPKCHWPNRGWGLESKRNQLAFLKFVLFNYVFREYIFIMHAFGIWGSLRVCRLFIS